MRDQIRSVACALWAHEKCMGSDTQTIECTCACHTGTHVHDLDLQECPACGEVATPGHDHQEPTDPYGAAVLAAHDRDDHRACHRRAPCTAPDRSALT